MTTKTNTPVEQIKINRLNQTQFDNATTIENNELYAVDPQFTGGKVLATDSSGDIVESTVAPANIGTVKSVNNTSPDSNGNVAITIPTVNNATLTIQKNSTNVATFTANASSNVTANISVPTDTNDLTNGAGFITGITSTDVTTALGYTPYDSSNPNGYTSNTGTVTSVNNVSPVSGNVTLSIPTQASDIGAVATTDCAQIYPVIETYISGTSWYRIYADGWCEQGGVSSDTGNRPVALLKTYADTNYTVLVNTLGGLYNTLSTANKTSASEIRITTASTQSYTGVTADACWFTSGYLASNQYTSGTYKAYKP